MSDTKNDMPLVVILGPTASGKTKLAVNLSSKLNGEIISADSRQVYKKMNIGTGKDYEDYLPVFKQNNTWSAGIEGLHLVDIVEAGDSYNVAFFQQDFYKAYKNIITRHKIPILCGGTGMYIEAVLRNYKDTQIPINQEFRDKLEANADEELERVFQYMYAKINPNADISTRKRLIRAIEIGEFRVRELENKIEQPNTNRSSFITLNFGINIPVEVRRERITKRLYERLQKGMIEEVKALLESGISAEKLIFYGLEYKFITKYLLGDLSFDEMAQRLEVAIHQFAKRQMTFFRSMERKGMKINWLDGMNHIDEMTNEIMNMVKKQTSF